MEDNKGWISLHRKFIDWEWYDNANVMRLFLHLLLCANHKNNKWRGKVIKRGQLITSQPKLANSLKLSISQIRNSLTKLKSTGEITVEKTNEYSIISIKNYDIYQDDSRRESARKKYKNQSSDSRTTTNNNDNKERDNKLSLSNSERDNLKNYLLSRPRKEPIYDLDAYLAELKKNNTLKDKLEKALKWNQKQTQKAQQEKSKENIPLPAEIEQEDKSVTDAARDAARKKIQGIRRKKNG